MEIVDGDTTWRFERAFLTSNWTCIWGLGCQGILPERAEDLGQGCCSVGAGLDEGDESRAIGALAAMIPDELFEQRDAAAAGGVYRDADRTHTRVVDGACIFFNRPDFPGGAGCALHLAAVAEGEPVTDWKPSVCWQLPIRVEWAPDPESSESGGAAGADIATVRRWTRSDWGAEGETMAWCCTEEPDAYIGDLPVVASLAGELEAITGPEVFVELRRRLTVD